MSTAGDILTASFIKVGVNTPTTDQTASGLKSLNNMVSFWGADLPDHAPTSETLTIGTSSAEYTIGSGGDLDTVRPMSIDNCFIRDSEGYDYPLDPMSSADYNKISDKDISGRPTKYYFNPEFPLAKITFNSVPDASYTAYFEFRKNYTVFVSTTTTTDASWPGEYLEALVYNLAVSLGEDWDRKIPPTVYTRAIETRNVIDRFNVSNRPIPRARFDFGSRKIYNINTDI